MGRSCPLHSAQPFGGKLKDIIRISDRNGVDMASTPGVARRRRRKPATEWSRLRARREDALQRDTKVERQVWHHVVMREASTADAHRQCIEEAARRRAGVDLHAALM